MNKKDAKYFSITTAVSMLILLGGCEKPEVKVLKQLCAVDAGYKVYEDVKIDGIFDTTETGSQVLSNLIQPVDGKTPPPYRYTDFCRTEPADLIAPGSLKLGEGCWRVEKVPRDSGRCSVVADNSMKRFVTKPWTEFMKNNCIAITKIEYPTTGYKSEFESKNWFDSKYPEVKVWRYEWKKVDIEKNSVISRGVTYDAKKKKAHTTINCSAVMNK